MKCTTYGGKECTIYDEMKCTTYDGVECSRKIKRKDLLAEWNVPKKPPPQNKSEKVAIIEK